MPGVGEFTSEAGGAGTVVGVAVLVPSPGVVKECEQEHDLGIRVGQGAAEDEPCVGDRTPVLLAVHPRASQGCARANRVEQLVEVGDRRQLEEVR